MPGVTNRNAREVQDVMVGRVAAIGVAEVYTSLVIAGLTKPKLGNYVLDFGARAWFYLAPYFAALAPLALSRFSPHIEGRYIYFALLSLHF